MRRQRRYDEDQQCDRRQAVLRNTDPIHTAPLRVCRFVLPPVQDKSEKALVLRSWDEFADLVLADHPS